MKKIIGNITPIGGEQFYSPSFIFSSKKSDVRNYFENKFRNKEISYTYGGYYSIKLILDNLNILETDHILLPSYLCPTIILPFKEKGIRYSFYKINSELKIDIKDLEDKINSNTRAVFFINYFGFDISTEEKRLLKNLKHKGVILIQDLVQCFYASANMLIGDFAFNSFRKFFPAEGSCIISDKKLELKNKTFNSLYFYNKLLGRYYRYKYYKKGLPESKFLGRFSRASSFYHKKGICGLTYYDEFILNKYDFKNSLEVRRKNFNLLLKNFKNIALFKTFEDDIVPLAFPIIVGNRDEVLKKLMKENIFCPIHWKLSEEINKEQYGDSWSLSEEILSIPTNVAVNYEVICKVIKLLI